MVGGIRPYSLEISARGDIAVFSDQGGGQGDIDVINVIDLKSKPPRVVDTISVGQTPEGVSMSQRRQLRRRHGHEWFKQAEEPPRLQ